MTVPHATATVDGVPYAVERHVFGGVPCLVERPLGEIRGLAIVYHGVTASKEGNLGVFASLIAGGVAVVLPDSAGHGEREEDTLTAEMLGYRNFVRTCAARTALEAPRVIAKLRDAYGMLPISVIGISMGGYTAHFLALRERRVEQVVVISSGGTWEEPEVTLPFARQFIEAHRPVTHARLAPPARLLLLHGDADPVFPMSDFEATAQAYREAYDDAEQPQRFQARVFPGVGHYTSPEMRDAAVRFVLGEDDSELTRD